MDELAASIVVPTQNRSGYLDVALASLAAQECVRPHDVVVVDDASVDATPAIAKRWGVRYIRHERPLGINAARNVGVRASTAQLIIFLDDDVLASPRWLAAMVEGAERHPSGDAFGGPIRARFEGRTPSSCGREPPPITTLDLGSQDVEAKMVWGANMAIRRAAFERLGMFDETIMGHGDEEDWLLALRAAGGHIVYLAAAGVEHRRAGADARLPALAMAAYRRGRAARITDERRDAAPSVFAELRTVAGCGWHTLHYRCPQGAIMGSHSAGRLIAALRRR